MRDANYSRQPANSTLDIAVSAALSLTVAVSSTSALVSQSVSLSYAGNATNQAAFSWALDGGTVLSGSGRGPLIVRWNLPGVKRVQLTVTQNGCSVTSSVLSLTINGPSTIDEPCTAAQVTAYAGLCPTDLPRISLAGATASTGDYGSCLPATAKDVWVKFTITTVQPAYINILNSNMGDNDEAQLLSATSCTGSFTQIGCSVSYGPSSFYYSSLAPGTYYFRIYDYYDLYYGTAPRGEFSLCVAGSNTVTRARLLGTETTVCRGTVVSVPVSVSGSNSVLLAYDEIPQSGSAVSRTVVVSNAVAGGSTSSLTVVANQNVSLVLRHARPLNSTIASPLSGTYTINVTNTTPVQVSLNISSTVVPAQAPVTVQPIGNLDLLNGDLVSWDFAQSTVLPGTGIGPHTVSWNSPGLKTIAVSVSRGNCSAVTATRQIRVQPINDEICNATPILVSPVVCRPVVQYNLSGATSTTQSLPNWCNYNTTGQGDVWFQFTISGTQSVGITTSAGSLTDVAMQIFAASACQNSLSLINCTDNNVYTSQSYTMPEARLANLSPGTYYIRIIGQNGLEGTFGLCAYVISPPSAQFDTNSFSICSGTSIALPILVSSIGTVQLNYAEITNGIRTNRQVFVYGSGFSSYSLIVAPTQRTVYRLISLTDFASATPIAIALQDSAVVEPTGVLPTATFTSSASLISTGQALTLTYTGTGTPTDQYNWDFSAATILSGTGAGPYVIRWLEPGSQSVRLVVSRNQYCSSTAVTQSISVTGVHPYDQVCNAITLPVQTTYCSAPPIQYNTSGATSGTYVGCSPYRYDVWYKFSLLSSASILITTSIGTLRYPQVQVLTGPTCTSLTQLQCTAYTSVNSVQPPVLSLSAGTYYVRLAGDYSGTFGICINQVRLPEVAFSSSDLYNCVGQPASIPISLSGIGPWRVSYDEINGSNRVSRQVLLGTNQTASPAIYALSIPVSNTSSTRVILTALSDSVYTQRPVSGTLTVNPITSVQTAFSTNSLTALTGSVVTAQLTSTAIPGATYIWDFEDGTPNAAIGSTSQLMSWRAPGLKTITLRAEKAGCLTDVSSRTVLVSGANLMDNPCQAVSLTPVSQTAPFTLYSTQGSTTANGIPTPSCFPDQPVNDVWFSFSLAAASDIAFQTQSRTLDGSFIQLLSASACSGIMQELRCAVADLPAGDEGITSPVLRFNSLPPGRYWVRLGATDVGQIGVRLLLQAPQPPTAIFTDADATLCSSGTQPIGMLLTGKGPWSVTYTNNSQTIINTFGNAQIYGPLVVSLIGSLTVGVNQFVIRAVSDALFPTPQSSPDTLSIQVASLLTGLQTDNIMTTSAVLRWSGISNGTYTVQWRLLGTTDWTSADDLTENTLALNDLVSGGLYEWRVRVSCPDANTVNFATATFQLRCIILTGLQTNNITTTSAVLSWSSLTTGTYIVQWRLMGTTDWSSANNLTENTLALTNLVPGGLYEWRVRVSCPDANTINFSTATFLLSCPTVPTISRTLFLNIQSINRTTGVVVFSGVDTRGPTTPGLTFTWLWGDGTSNNGFFPQLHQYNDLTRNYSTSVVANYSTIEKDTVSVLVAFVGPIISTIAGPPNIGDNGQAILATLNNPEAIATDAAGNVYITEGQPNRIRRISPTGVITTIAGTGEAGFSGDGGPATAAQLNYPTSIVVDAAGNVFFSDWANNRIRKISTSGIITTVAGNGNYGFSGDGGQATSAMLNGAYGIAIDASNVLYIADWNNHRIRKVAPDGIITTIAGTAAGAGFSGDGGPATAARLNSPSGVAVDANGNIYIGDYQNWRIRKISTSGVISTLAGTGTQGAAGDGGAATAAQMSFFAGPTVDGSGNVYVSDFFNNRIRKISTNGIITRVAGTTAGPGNYGDGGPATLAALSNPLGLAVDVSGNFLIADRWNQRIRRVNTAGIISRIAGPNNFGFGGDGNLATLARLSFPTDVKADGNGNIYISDYSNSCIRKIDDLGVISTVVGTTVGGYGGDGGPATMAKLLGANSVLPDANGNLYIADTYNNSIRKVNSNGIISTIAGTTISGFSGDNSSAINARLNLPFNIALDASGNLYIADANNHRIRKVSTSGIITTIVGTGIAGFGGDCGAATSAQINFPTGIAVDAADNLYIVDSRNHRIRKVTPWGIVSTIAGTGTVGYSGNNSPAIAAQLSYPFGIAVSATGTVFFSDNGNARVRKISPSGIITDVAGSANRGYLGDNSLATAAQIDGPSGIGLDGSGNLLIADGANARIRKIACVDPPSVSLVASSATVCVGDVVSLTPVIANNSSRMTFNWLGNTIPTSVSTLSASVVAGLNTFTVTVTTPTGCSASALISLHAGPLYSIKNGNWDDPTVWSCGRVPVSVDPVTLNHAVTIPANFSGNALRLVYGTGSRLLYGPGSRLRLGL